MKKPLLVLLSLPLAACQPKHSPEPATPEDSSAHKVQPSGEVPTPSSFIGLTLEAAEAKAEKADLPHRVIKRDGEGLPVTRDYRPERLNFTLEKGIVTVVTNG